MRRTRSIHSCSECGATSPCWRGRCPSCGEWNTLAEHRKDPPSEGMEHVEVPAEPPVEILEVPAEHGAPIPTGIAELDRVLDGGLVRGSATLIAGEPGTGKSTLLLQLLASVALSGKRALLVSAEESLAHVRARAGRLNALVRDVWIVAASSVPMIEQTVVDVGAEVVVIDSIQTVFDPEVTGPAGSVAQVRACTRRLVSLFRSTSKALVLVGHVTKDGSLAGPRVLEHTVDTVLSLEGDRHHALRLLRSVKHRFGPAGELGVFEMTATGLVGVADASGLLLCDRVAATPGSAVCCHLDGRRPLLVEVQALVVGTQMPSPRRSVSGTDSARLALLLAVLERRASLALSRHDVFVSAVGGVRLSDPGADLAVCLALASAATGVPGPLDVVVLGEVGLGGELRQVAYASRRLAEAARLGFGRAIVPATAPVVEGIEMIRHETLVGALGSFLPTGVPRRLTPTGVPAA
jgi:DNA repair protein RadA/Sms